MRRVPSPRRRPAARRRPRAAARAAAAAVPAAGALAAVSLAAVPPAAVPLAAVALAAVALAYATLAAVALAAVCPAVVAPAVVALACAIQSPTAFFKVWGGGRGGPRVRGAGTTGRSVKKKWGGPLREGQDLGAVGGDGHRVLGVRRAAGAAGAMPARRAASVVAISRASAGRGLPMVKEIAASAVHPSSTAPQSTLTRSPSVSR